jgi:autotransporter-associated beta strand protein
MLVGLAVAVPTLAAATVSLGVQTVVLNDNGAWCWFQDERAIVDGNTLIVGSVANASGTNGAARDGNVEVAAYNLSTGAHLGVSVLHPHLEPGAGDDHDAPAFLVRPDGRILAVYAEHTNNRKIYYRISTNPHNPTSWQAEQVHTTPLSPNPGDPDRRSNVGYSNVYRLSAENGGAGRVYDFYRGIGFDPNYSVSNDNGATWTYGGRLMYNDDPNDVNIRPYVTYASNGVDTIHFINNEANPGPYPTSIYHAYIRGGNIYKTDGTLIGPLGTPMEAAAGTLIFQASETAGWAWSSDLQLDSLGRPVATFSVTKDVAADPKIDHRYHYARWDGAAWHDHEIAYGGRQLSNDGHYTGLITLNPNDIDVVFIATDANPVTGVPLQSAADGQRHFEVYKGYTPDSGTTWIWSPVTTDSTVDNVRPVVPKWDASHTALLWMKGTYATYTDYDLDIVGRLYAGRDGAWSSTSGGTWSAAANWTDAQVAGGASMFVDFGRLDISGTVTVNVDGAKAAGVLLFGDANTSTPGNWVLADGGGSIALDNDVYSIVKVANQTVTINVPLTGAGIPLLKQGGGTLVLGAANTYGGPTTTTAGTLRLDSESGPSIPGNLALEGDGTGNLAVYLNHDEQIADGGVLSFSNASTSYYSRLYLEGHTETVAGISCPDDRGIIQNGNLIVDNPADCLFAGYLRDNGGPLSLVKRGSGVLTLSGSHIYYTGGTSVSGGKLVLRDTTNATFLPTHITNDAMVEFDTATANVHFAGTISGSGGLRKTGSYKLTLGSAANSYGGTTTVVAGVLAAAATAVPGDVIIQSGGAFAPGDVDVIGSATTGTATLSGLYLFEINDADGTAGANWDLWNVMGDILIGPTSTVAVRTLGGASAGPMADFDSADSYRWLVASATGAISGLGNLVLDTTLFQNPIAPSGRFEISQSGDGQVYLCYLPSIPGDADGNGTVGSSDAAALAAHWGDANATWATGDFDGDRVVGPGDASILAANWGHGTSEAGAVPEPGIAVLLAAGVTMLAGRRRP